mmetsp:Transcript_29553/g.96584  ORF Transcript_29553/g.96584 Transcript_29553/m.96584 type:complete len:227 (+) Transcript_29553:202-882(+)
MQQCQFRCGELRPLVLPSLDRALPRARRGRTWRLPQTWTLLWVLWTRVRWPFVCDQSNAWTWRQLQSQRPLVSHRVGVPSRCCRSRGCTSPLTATGLRHHYQEPQLVWCHSKLWPRTCLVQARVSARRRGMPQRTRAASLRHHLCQPRHHRLQQSRPCPEHSPRPAPLRRRHRRPSRCWSQSVRRSHSWVTGRGSWSRPASPKHWAAASSCGTGQTGAVTSWRGRS